MSRRISYVALAAVVVPAVVVGGVPWGGLALAPAWAARPWIARTPPVAPPAAHQLRDLGRWPAEPAEPRRSIPARFRLSVEHLCERPKDGVARPAKAVGKSRADKAGKSRRGRKADTRAAEGDSASGGTDADGEIAGATTIKPGEPPLGDLVQAAAAEAGVDPFLLAGLMYEESGCRPKLESPRGYGLLRIHPGLYQSPGAPTPPGDKEDWRMAALLDPAENLRLGAKLLQMWSETHTQLDATFGGVPHRGRCRTSCGATPCAAAAPRIR